MTLVDWTGDLNLGGASLPQDEWQAQMSLYTTWYRYFSGLVLEERVTSSGQAVAPLLYPVKLNLCKLMCITQADALWGEWEDRLFTFELSPIWQDVYEEAGDKMASNLVRAFQHILDSSNFEGKGWGVGLDMMRYGGGVLRVAPDERFPFGVRIDRVPVRSFYPVWNPDDYDDLYEVYVALEISARAAEIIYGVRTQQDTVLRVERWTKTSYTNWVDGKKVPRFSGDHNWGVVPFVYIPRLRADGFFGPSLIDDVMAAQDELNMRVADIGEAIGVNAHPIRYGYNLPPEINDPAKFPYEPDALWDLGNTLPGADAPEIKMMEAQHAVKAEAFKHIDFIFDWSRHSAYSPPIVFGEDEGSQRSGATLMIRMWPLTRSVRRSRMHLRPALRKLVQIMLKVGEPDMTKRFGRGIQTFFRDSEMNVNFSAILPRERSEVVTEVTTRMQTSPPTISLEKALEMLDERDVGREMARIVETVAMLTDMQVTQAKAMAEAQPKPEPGEKDSSE